MTARRQPTQKQKTALLKRQDNRCNLPKCRKVLVSGLYEWDHIQDRQFDGDNATDNWQAICTKPCHQDKTARAAGSKARANHVRMGKARKGPPMPGSRKSRFKKHVDGRVSVR